MKPVSHSPDRRRVLLVEDEYLIAIDMKRMLEAHGCEIVGAAASVEAARAILNTAELDLAILDVGLTDGAVYPLIDDLERRRVPYAFATGYDPAALPASEANTPRLEKPVNPDLINDILKRTCARN